MVCQKKVWAYNKKKVTTECGTPKYVHDCYESTSKYMNHEPQMLCSGFIQNLCWSVLFVVPWCVWNQLYTWRLDKVIACIWNVWNHFILLKVNLFKILIYFHVNISEDFGLCHLDYYHYLSYGGNHKVEGTNDAHDFQETLKGEW